MGGLYHDPGVPPAVLAQAQGSEISDLYQGGQPATSPTLRMELSTLLEKGAIGEVERSDRKAGFYSRYFLIPKKDGGLRPILDIMGLNK